MERFFFLFTVLMALVILLLIMPAIGFISVFFATAGFTLYYAAIAAGLYKEPLLAQFRQYGDEPAVYPLGNALLAGGVCIISVTALLPLILAQGSFMARLLPTTVFTIVGSLLIVASIAVYWQPTLRTSLPPWYTDLIQHASRQERRQIGWAWLRLPFKMRIRLNGDTRAFAVWVELVRLTVIYGAYDPKSPWHRWT